MFFIRSSFHNIREHWFLNFFICSFWRSGLNFINILHTAFMLADPESTKKVKSAVSFGAFGTYEHKSCTQNIDEIEPIYVLDIFFWYHIICQYSYFELNNYYKRNLSTEYFTKSDFRGPQVKVLCSRPALSNQFVTSHVWRTTV